MLPSVPWVARELARQVALLLLLLLLLIRISSKVMSTTSPAAAAAAATGEVALVHRDQRVRGDVVMLTIGATALR